MTDAVRGNSELLALGDLAFIRNLPYQSRNGELFLLPGILSRKKQLLPEMLSITATFQHR